MTNAKRDARNEPPIADSAIRRTPSFPSLLPNTPLTNAPMAGSARMIATRAKSSGGKMFLRRSIDGWARFLDLVLEQIGFVAADRSAEPIDGETDRETDGRLGCGDRDDEERDHLAVVIVGPHAVEGDEGEVHGVEQELDAHQLNQEVAPHHEADRADGEDDAYDRDDEERRGELERDQAAREELAFERVDRPELGPIGRKAVHAAPRPGRE